jgi:tetratricopeptide (TPR) repeat protein
VKKIGIFKLVLAYACVLLASCQSCLSQSLPESASVEELYSTAQAAQQRGDYVTAAKAYQVLTERRPDVAEIWANLGVMYEYMGNYSKADYEFRIALQKKPKLYVPTFFLGLNQLRAHQFQAALHYLKTAVLLNPHDEHAALGLAQAYSGIYDDDDAAQWFDKARQLAPQDDGAWYGLGVSYSKLQDTAVFKLKELGPDEPYARSLVAESFLQQGRTKDAIRIYEKLRSEFGPPCVLSALGFAYVQAGDAERARQTFLNESKSHPECLLSRIGLAQLAFINDEIPSALEQLYFVIDKDPDFLERNLHRVWTRLDEAKVNKILTEIEKDPGVEDALKVCLRQSIETANPLSMSSIAAQKHNSSPSKQAGKIDPEKLWAEGQYSACAGQISDQQRPATTALRLLEACSFYAGQYRLTLETSNRILRTSEAADALYWKAQSAQELAAEAFAAMNAVAPDSPKAHLLLAELHGARQEFSAAESEYERVLARDSGDLNARLGLARVYFQTSEDDKATEQLRNVLKADASNVDAHSLLGRIFVRRHKYADALPHLKIALQGSPNEAPEIHSSLAQCYSASGKYSLALSELKLALPADTTGAFYYQAYQLYQKMGDQQSAAAALSQSAAIRRRESEAEQQRTSATGLNN